MEALDQAIRRYSFAILVASADDEIVKRGMSSAAMRDNVLLEFGLFAGALGRRRTYFVCPDHPELDLPSDLCGITRTTYDAARASQSLSDRAAAVQGACQQIRDAIREQWKALQQYETERMAKIKASKEIQAVQKLRTVAGVLSDSLMALQRNGFASLFSERSAFDTIKNNTTQEIRRLIKGFHEDARVIGVEKELDELQSAVQGALDELPFPDELVLKPEQFKKRVIGIGVGALRGWWRGRRPFQYVKKAVKDEAGERLSLLANRYRAWWDQHSPRLQEAAVRLEEALLTVLLRMSSDYSRAEAPG